MGAQYGCSSGAGVEAAVARTVRKFHGGRLMIIGACEPSSPELPCATLFASRSPGFPPWSFHLGAPAAAPLILLSRLSFLQACLALAPRGSGRMHGKYSRRGLSTELRGQDRSQCAQSRSFEIAGHEA